MVGSLSLVTETETLKTHGHSLNRDFAQEWLAVFVVRRKEMIDFVFFDGQLWPYAEWAKIAPLTMLCPEKEISPNARLWDEGYSNE